MAEEKHPGVAAAERLFPFVLRARKLLVGRESLLRRKRQLQMVLITTDISPASRKEILRDFADYPIIQHYSSEELGILFAVRGAKVIGFAKSTLAKSIYTGLKDYRVNKPEEKSAPDKTETGGKPHPEV